MKVLYAVQATGNGHLSRCMEFYPALSKYADVDVLLSGIQGDLKLPFPIKFKKHGLSFIFGKKGGIDYIKTALSMKPLRLWKDIRSLDLSPYDLVVNDFEPISAWACKRAKKECVALSHQAAFLSDKTPRPEKAGWIAEFLFKHFAPCSRSIGLHYKTYDDNIYTPVVRSEIRAIQTDYNNKDILVYLPAFSEELLVKKLVQLKDYSWNIFSKHVKFESVQENVRIFPVGTPKWNEVMKKASFALIGGGFEGPSEMLYLRKKILVIPMNDQYEQLCNAAALKEMGVKVLYQIDDTFINELKDWLANSQILDVDFPKRSDLLAQKALGLSVD